MLYLTSLYIYEIYNILKILMYLIFVKNGYQYNEVPMRLSTINYHTRALRSVIIVLLLLFDHLITIIFAYFNHENWLL